MDNEFRKDKLTSGCIVQLRNKEKFMYLEKARFYSDKINVFINLNNGKWISLKEYDDDLRNLICSTFDILKICNRKYVGDNLIIHIINNKNIWTAERECKGIFEEELEEMGLLKDKEVE